MFAAETANWSQDVAVGAPGILCYKFTGAVRF